MWCCFTSGSINCVKFYLIVIAEQFKVLCQVLEYFIGHTGKGWTKLPLFIINIRRGTPGRGVLIAPRWQGKPLAYITRNEEQQMNNKTEHYRRYKHFKLPNWFFSFITIFKINLYKLISTKVILLWSSNQSISKSWCKIIVIR